VIITDFEKIANAFGLIPSYMLYDLYEKHISEFVKAGYIKRCGSETFQRVQKPKS
jgi:hypothetical protein